MFKKIEQGIFSTCSKPASATAQWWNTFVRIKDDKENIIPFVQCIKCLSIFAYESCKTGSSTRKAHAESCLGGSSPTSRKEEQYVSNIDSHAIKDITDLFSVFKIGSEKLSADNVPTLHSVLPWFYKFRKSCEIKATDRPCIAQLRKKLLKKLDANLWLTDIHYIATFLHPETKSLPKRNKRAKRDDISVDDVLKEFISNENLSIDDEEPYDEVIEYMKRKVNYSSGEDVLSWWKKHSCIYSQLSRLALALLSIPASSATSERIFSETGRILEARRQLLSAESLDSLVFLRNFR
ncbi:unnamed protein product [Rotaria sordida]|uniref:HAT C-terminal dimerisation domain-containing protein n=1 Tax=Rotaria sordida TaxID=392033 RepID=A0A814IDG8_9BILA|nr:unnamed protein product [Rotaria sordida]